MYDRRLDGKVLSFGHAGILVGSSFVLYDRGTGSLWVHVTGRAEYGPLKGKRLKFLPSTVTTWGQWKRSYPHTLVLPGYRRGGFMGTYKGTYQSFGLGLAVLVNFQAKLYPFARLKRTPVVNDTFNGVPLLVFYSQKAGTGTAWLRTLDGQVLDFDRSPQKDPDGNVLLRDRQTGSLWSWLKGEAVSGRLQGRMLDQLSYNPILNNRFKAFYPEAPIYE